MRRCLCELHLVRVAGVSSIFSLSVDSDGGPFSGPGIGVSGHPFSSSVSVLSVWSRSVFSLH